MNDPARGASGHEPLQPPSPLEHETSDASALAIGSFALGLAILIAVALLLVVWIYRALETSFVRSEPAPSPVAVDQTPPEPRLQTDPAADLVRLRQADDERLSSYRWVDRRKGIVRVPIERAIDLLAERGFPEPEGGEEEMKNAK